MPHSESLVPLPVVQGLWQRLTEPSPALQEPGLQRRARLLSSLQLALILLGVVTGIAPSLIGVMPYDTFFTVILIFVTLLIGLYGLGRTRHYAISATLTVLFTSAGSFAIALIDPDAGSMGLLVYLLIPVLVSGMLLSLRTTLWVVIVQVVGIFALETALDTATPDDNWLTFVPLTSVLVLIALRHQALIERDQRLLAEALVDTSLAINNTLDQQHILEAIMETVQQVVPFDTASIMLIEDGAATVMLHRGFGCFAPGFDIGTMKLEIDDTPNLRKMVATCQPVIIDDTHTLSWWRVGNEVSDWIRSYLGMPICVGTEVIGFINLDSSRPNTFSPTDAQRLKVLATQVAIAINNARLYARERQHISDLEQRVQQRTEALQQSTERVEAILNNSSDAIIFTDREGRIQQANFTFDELLLYHPDDLLGQPLGFIVDTASDPVLTGHLNSLQTAGRKIQFEVIARRKDGATFQAEMGLSPVRRGDEISGIVCTVRDITPYKLAEENLRLALKRERELGELKSRFVVMASHEFRTPLATIQVAADVLRHYTERMTAEQREQSFDKIQQQVLHMTSMLDDILMVGRLDAGVVQLNLIVVHVSAFLNEVVDDLRQSMTTHPIVLENGGSDIESAVDQKLLRQIITNLLSNAVKYSPDGCEVRCTLTCGADQFTFSVRDTGIGIPPEDRMHLFEVFHRGSNVDTRPGSGLGLAITQQAVEMLGGTIVFESEVNQGSTFTVTIPVIDPANAGPGAEES